MALNKAMLRNAEDFVNRLNSRVFTDSLALAERDVEMQKAKFSEIEARLTEFRNTQNVLDPEQGGRRRPDPHRRLDDQAVGGRERTRAETHPPLAPRAPAIAGLTSQVSALRDQIAFERQRLSGRHHSLSGKFAEFDHLMLERALASKQLEFASANTTGPARTRAASTSTCRRS